MRCLIVDDEPLAQKVLERYIGMLEGITIAGKCSNAFQAINFLQTQQIDLILLDIQMPELSGLDMLRHLRQPPQVILTTAFSEHALTAFDLDVLDYLLKPISFERFARAIDKVRNKMPIIRHDIETVPTSPYLFLKAERKLHKVFIADIILVEGLSNYLKVYTTQGVLVVREKISEIENVLSKGRFMRVHKSFIIALPHIECIDGNHIKTKQYRVPIGETYRAAFLKAIGDL